MEGEVYVCVCVCVCVCVRARDSTRLYVFGSTLRDLGIEGNIFVKYDRFSQ